MQGQLKLNLQCLLKHMAEACVPNSRRGANSKPISNLCLITSSRHNNGTSQRCKPKSEANSKLCALLFLNLSISTQPIHQKQVAMPNHSLIPSCLMANTKCTHSTPPPPHTHTHKPAHPPPYPHTQNNKTSKGQYQQNSLMPSCLHIH